MRTAIGRIALIAGATAGLAGCETLGPEARVQHALVKAGIQPAVARCMAHRMVDRLSIAQLRQLQSAVALPDQQLGHLSVHEVVKRVKAIGDPDIVIVTSRAAIGCEIADG